MGRAQLHAVRSILAVGHGTSDGSSRLAPGHKWADFPSVGLAWQVGDESFMRGRSRCSTRSSCAAATERRATRRSRRTRRKARCSASLYTFGNTRVRGYKPGSIPNPDLAWEKTDQNEHRPRLRAVQQPHLRHGRWVQAEHERPAADAAAPGDVGLHVDAAEHRRDEEHRVSSSALDASTSGTGAA